jgi:hypothetical protein
MIAAATFFSLHATPLQLAAQVAKKMFCVHVAGDELGTITHDLPKNGFAISVNECHFDQVNDAPSRVTRVPLFLPSQLELCRPLSDQLTLQGPPLLVGRTGYSDLQHYSPSTACQKSPTSEAHHSKKEMAVEEPNMP